MMKNKKATAKLKARQTEYDRMIDSAQPHEQAFLKAAYHRPGSLKK